MYREDSLFKSNIYYKMFLFERLQIEIFDHKTIFFYHLQAAIDCYNKAISHAKDDSVLALGYANR